MKRIPVTINYKAISELKYYKKKCTVKIRESIKWGNRTLSLPLHKFKFQAIKFYNQKS